MQGIRSFWFSNSSRLQSPHKHQRTRNQIPPHDESPRQTTFPCSLHRTSHRAKRGHTSHSPAWYPDSSSPMANQARGLSSLTTFQEPERAESRTGYVRSEGHNPLPWFASMQPDREIRRDGPEIPARQAETSSRLLHTPDGASGRSHLSTMSP